MKTNVTLSSTDRELFGVAIRQGTKPDFLSVTDLMRAYEKERMKHNWHSKHLPTLMKTTDFKDRVYYLLVERSLVDVSKDTFTEMVDRESIVKVLKGLGVWKNTGLGTNNTTMADPYIWVLIAMEMNPMIYAKVVKWLGDTLIFDRIEAGTENRVLVGAVNSMLGGQAQESTYRSVNTELNIKVFGMHKTGIRNLASSVQLKKIAEIEKFVAKAITAGWVKTEDEVINAIKNYN
jgi:hypothetical protein